MKNATSIILPEEVLDFILLAYDTKEKCSSKLGCHSFVHNLTKDLNTFIQLDNIHGLKKKFFNGISEYIIQRAFNFKKNGGATEATRNLLSLYATDSKYDWNGMIKKYFPLLSTLSDKHKKTTARRKKHHTIDEVYAYVQRLDRKITKKIFMAFIVMP
jgi:hypothetical protein